MGTMVSSKLKDFTTQAIFVLGKGHGRVHEDSKKDPNDMKSALPNERVNWTTGAQMVSSRL